jgi:hypothetical protein
MLRAGRSSLTASAAGIVVLTVIPLRSLPPPLQCWSQSFVYSDGPDSQCGASPSHWEEQKVAVTCDNVYVPGTELTVTVGSTLNQPASDESFAIDDVSVKLKTALSSDFTRPGTHDEFEATMDGWNCGAVTTCGAYGKVCGGYNQKGNGQTLSKTYAATPGSYDVSLDFLKIDSWSV